MHLVIRQAEIVNADGRTRGDVLVRGGHIVQVADQVSPPAGEPLESIDAGGMLLLPGGLDPHVHMHLPTAAGFSSDDFVSGSRAALLGGTTTLIDFVTPRRGMSLTDALAARLMEARRCHTDYSFHVSPVEWRDSTAAEIRDCIAAGLPSFKLYMAYKDSIGIDEEVMAKVMRTVAKEGGMVTVHCETGDEVDRLRRELAESGQTGPASHPESRPPHTESQAVEKAIALCAQTACPVYIVHVSAAASIEHIRKAQSAGLPVMAEVCPHHLLLDESVYDAPFEQAAPFVLSPPLRSESDRNALWGALADGTVEVVGTDHCPFFMEQKAAGRNDFRLIANGAGGVEHRLALIYTHGVLEGRISHERWVALCSTGPARLFGLYPRKGRICRGADADMVLWDPHASEIVSAARHHHRSDISIYEGMTLRGKARMVIKSGKVVVEDGQQRRQPAGSFLRRKVPEKGQ